MRVSMCVAREALERLRLAGRGPGETSLLRLAKRDLLHVKELVAVPKNSGSPPKGSPEKVFEEGDSAPPGDDSKPTGRTVTAARCLSVGRVIMLSVLLVLIAGNALIAGATIWAKGNTPDRNDLELRGIDNLVVVNDRLMRGAAPSQEGYKALSDRGVKTVIDLRAEDKGGVDPAKLERLGMELVHIPVRDGQAPSSQEVRSFLRAVDSSEGRVFVHCGAGVGRTGTMAAAYLVEHGEASPTEALARNLAVGPPSLEQVAFVSEMGGGSFERPSFPITALSRFLDAPRRLASRLGL
jgi:protein-tyrosine phosphatase